jgi:hypothetical protein
MLDTQTQISAEEARKPFETEADFLNHYEPLYGKYDKTLRFEFIDARVFSLSVFENGFIFRAFNPNNPEDLQGVQINLTREAMSALNALYYITCAFRSHEDDRLLIEHLTDEHREAYVRFMKDITDEFDRRFQEAVEAEKSSG